MENHSNTNTSALHNNPEPPIAIVGAGLGGLALAIGLVKNGVTKIQIYEAAPAFWEIGAAVPFGPNGTQALHLIEPKLLEAYNKHATFDEEDQDRGSRVMSFRWGVDERREGGKKAGDVMWHLENKRNSNLTRDSGVLGRSCIHRARLVDSLIAQLPEGIIRFRKRFQHLEEQDDGALKLCFADGTSTLASALIGCDGTRSQVRAVMYGPGVEPTYAGEYAFRAMVPKSEAEEALGRESARNGQLYCGYDAFIVTYPVEHGNFIRMVAISRAWTWQHKAWTIPTAQDEFLDKFKTWYSPVVDLMGRHLENGKWASFDMQHSMPYNRGRMCLLGDSAHATTPHLGADAGMAMEDAYILSHLVAHVKDVSRIGDAFRAFDAVRRPRTQQLVHNSRAAGLALSFKGLEGEDDAAALKTQFSTWYEWLWHEDLEAQLEAAQEHLQTSQ